MSNEENYSAVTNVIVEAIESGDIFNWERPWIPTLNFPLNGNNKTYNVMNNLLLGYSTRKNNFEGRNWLTKHRINKEFGGHVDEDQIPTKIYATVVKYLSSNGKWLKRRYSDEDKKVFVFQQWDLYNIDQVLWPSGCPSMYDHLPPPKNTDIKDSSEFKVVHKFIDPYLKHYKIYIDYTDTIAAYMPGKDKIIMPPIEDFKDQRGYGQVILHETIHSTGHKSRLKRKMICNHNTEEYSLEEFVAELGAAMLMAKLGILPAEQNEQSKAYIKGWVPALKGNTKLISIADSQARNAIRMIEQEVDKEYTVENQKEKLKKLIDKTITHIRTNKW